MKNEVADADVFYRLLRGKKKTKNAWIFCLIPALPYSGMYLGTVGRQCKAEKAIGTE